MLLYWLEQTIIVGQLNYNNVNVAIHLCLHTNINLCTIPYRFNNRSFITTLFLIVHNLNLNNVNITDKNENVHSKAHTRMDPIR